MGEYCTICGRYHESLTSGCPAGGTITVTYNGGDRMVVDKKLLSPIQFPVVGAMPEVIECPVCGTQCRG